MDTSVGETRRSLGSAAGMLLTGQAFYILITQLHAGGDANDHHAIFEEYAHSGIWSAVHVGQFAGMALILAGLVCLILALDGRARQVGWFGAALAGATLALYAALQAVDGVALKQAVSAWAHASEADQSARFTGAETIRWLEWGMRSYNDYMMGLTLLVFAIAVSRAAWGSFLISALMALSGFAYLAQGWIAGSQGFSPAQSIAIVSAWVLSACWMAGLAIAAWGHRRVPLSPVFE
ncbi:MAG TPA: hypothetical protein VIL84_08290 [Devosiaceae bacterium]